MSNRLAGAVSPYLRSHADNPVDWWPWSPEAFEEARRRDVPVLVSIGYSTCHWCHVMARESFGDPAIAAVLNAGCVSIKVDREEHPEVDAAYLAAASAFTPDLGWPLNVFATPDGRAFFAGTYFAPEPVGGRASFRQILEAVGEAWRDRREEVEAVAARVAEAVAAAGSREERARDAAASGADETAGPAGGTAVSTERPGASGGAVSPERPGPSGLPDSFVRPAARDGALGPRALEGAAAGIVESEDREFGGFGGAPKFPVAPLIDFLLRERAGYPAARRALEAMARSPLRDPVDGGFFRYATRRDWSEPHYERMLSDNALLLDDYTTAWRKDPDGSAWAAETASGIARFLTDTMSLPDGAFCSAQDSESVVDGERREGHYYRVPAPERAALAAPPRDEKVLTGWNGLAIGALARSGLALGRADWVEAARRAADTVLRRHLAGGAIVRASDGDRVSSAPATLEDVGGFADGLLALALATGEVDYAVRARELIDRVSARGSAAVFDVGDGGDPVLRARGIGVGLDTSDGAVPSGFALAARACHTLYLLTGRRTYRDSAAAAAEFVSGDAVRHPGAHGSMLAVARELADGPSQLVAVVPDAASAAEPGTASTAEPGTESEVLAEVRRTDAQVVAIVSEHQAERFAAAGFELFEGRSAARDRVTAYFCRDFVCSLPAVTAEALRAQQH